MSASLTTPTPSFPMSRASSTTASPIISRSGARSNTSRMTTAFYWGTPLVPANAPRRRPGPRASSRDCGVNITLGLPISRGHTGQLHPVTIDARTLSTNYKRARQQERRARAVAAQRRPMGYHQQCPAQEPSLLLFRRSGTGSTTRSIHTMTARRRAWGAQGDIYRERLSVDHDQKALRQTSLTSRSIPTLQEWTTVLVATALTSSLQFNAVQDDDFTNDTVRPGRSQIAGSMAPQLTKNFFTHVDDAAAGVRRPP